MIKFIAKQKFRFDLGAGFLSVINFAFVVIAASDTLARWVNMPALVMVGILVPLAMFSVWIFGLILDKQQFSQAYQAEQNHRNEMLKAIHEKTD